MAIVRNGRTLRKVREDQGMPVYLLAKFAGVSKDVIHAIENRNNNGHRVNVATAERICGVLEAPVDSIDWPNGLTQKGGKPGTGRNGTMQPSTAKNALEIVVRGGASVKVLVTFEPSSEALRQDRCNVCFRLTTGHSRCNCED